MAAGHMLSGTVSVTLALTLLAGGAGAQTEVKKNGNGNGNGLPNVVVLATGGTIAGAAASDVAAISCPRSTPRRPLLPGPAAA